MAVIYRMCLRKRVYDSSCLAACPEGQKSAVTLVAVQAKQ
jgi:hypothetical protein